MVSRALRFSKAEIANAARICREEGVVVKLDRDGSMLVFPDSHKTATVDTPPAETTTALQQWREKRDADKARGRA